ncbi:PAS domain S-box protein [Alginatibacterium sediminis]|uniref:PAS domain S-box protein n=1 Tax=Alginatibacterium sediminis TaxID=2164068 RepID=A0A420EFV7_9ALTE|nr:PAS domain S-box protein [Alginatibacterium sediminis]RKF19592.1 PAS domain S-box protein [Alginatibacterium sediminis]
MSDDINEFHWMAEMIQTIDVGLVVLDKEYNIKSWNTFMEAHSSMRPDQVQGKNVFDLFPNIDKNWLTGKIDTVFTLNNRAFVTWEQRPFVFPFNNYRPITGIMEHMYQNVTIIPLTSLTGQVTHVSLIVYDVTDTVAYRQQILEAQQA